MDDNDFEEDEIEKFDFDETMNEEPTLKMDVYEINMFIKKLDGNNNRIIESSLTEILKIPLKNYLEPSQFPFQFFDSMMKLFESNQIKIIDLASQFLYSLIKYNPVFLNKFNGSCFIARVLPKIKNIDKKNHQALFRLLEICSLFSQSSPVVHCALGDDYILTVLEFIKLSLSRSLDCVFNFVSSNFFSNFTETVEERVLSLCNAVIYTEEKPYIESIAVALRIAEAILRKNPLSNFVSFLASKNDLFKPISLIPESVLVLDSSLSFFTTISSINDQIKNEIIDAQIIQSYIKEIKTDKITELKQLVINCAKVRPNDVAVCLCTPQFAEHARNGFTMKISVKETIFYLISLVVCENNNTADVIAFCNDCEFFNNIIDILDSDYSPIIVSIFKTLISLYHRLIDSGLPNELLEIIVSDVVTEAANTIIENEQLEEYGHAILEIQNNCINN